LLLTPPNKQPRRNAIRKHFQNPRFTPNHPITMPISQAWKDRTPNPRATPRMIIAPRAAGVRELWFRKRLVIGLGIKIDRCAKSLGLL
jgi:hypothetical protein